MLANSVGVLMVKLSKTRQCLRAACAQVRVLVSTFVIEFFVVFRLQFQEIVDDLIGIDLFWQCLKRYHDKVFSFPPIVNL